MKNIVLAIYWISVLKIQLDKSTLIVDRNCGAMQCNMHHFVMEGFMFEKSVCWYALLRTSSYYWPKAHIFRTLDITLSYFISFIESTKAILTDYLIYPREWKVDNKLCNSTLKNSPGFIYSQDSIIAIYCGGYI